MKQLMIAAFMLSCFVSMTGCQMMESAKTGIVNKYNARVLKSDIESKCKECEGRGDFKAECDYLTGLMKDGSTKEGWNDDVATMVKHLLAETESKLLRKTYEGKIADYEANTNMVGLVAWMDGELAASPKPIGWSAEIETFLKSKADSSRAKALIQQIEAKCLAFVDKKDAVGLNKYLVGLMQKKPEGWDASVEKLCTEWLAKVTALIVDAENMRVMAAVKKALDKRDFVTARKLTSVADPFGEDEMVRNATLAFRICLLNTLINPYQGECILDEMEKKVAELKAAGDKAGARKYVEECPLVVDKFPSIHQKVSEFRPGLEHLYYIRKTADGFLSKYDAQIQGIMDRRTGSAYKDYEEILNLSRAVSDEMMRYNPSVEESTKFGDSMYRDAQRSMTTADLNDVIRQGKDALLKTL